jgi:hypothetical protein
VVVRRRARGGERRLRPHGRVALPAGDLEAKPFDSPLVEDEGLDVVAMPVGGSERAAVFLPLAPGAARDAIAAALG